MQIIAIPTGTVKDTSYLDRCPSEKNSYARKLKENSTTLYSVESLINEVFDKNIILATLSFAKAQKPVQTETTAGCLIEFIGYLKPR